MKISHTKDFPTPDTWLAHRVSYGETDTMGVLYYAEYLHLFERGRSEFIRERGMSYREVEERGIMLPVRKVSCRYRSPARYDDLIRLRIGISEWKKVSITFTYQLFDEEKNTLMATGMTQHACVNKAGRPVPVPDWLKKMFS